MTKHEPDEPIQQDQDKPPRVEMFSDWSSVTDFLGASADAGGSAIGSIIKFIFFAVIFLAALKILLPLL